MVEEEDEESGERYPWRTMGPRVGFEVLEPMVCCCWVLGGVGGDENWLGGLTSDAVVKRWLGGST